MEYLKRSLDATKATGLPSIDAPPSPAPDKAKTLRSITPSVMQQIVAELGDLSSTTIPEASKTLAANITAVKEQGITGKHMTTSEPDLVTVGSAPGHTVTLTH